MGVLALYVVEGGEERQARMKEIRQALTVREERHIANIMLRRRKLDVAKRLGVALSTLQRAWSDRKMSPSMRSKFMALQPGDIPKTPRVKRVVRPESYVFIPPSTANRRTS